MRKYSFMNLRLLYTICFKNGLRWDIWINRKTPKLNIKALW